MVSAARPCLGALFRGIKTPLGADFGGRLILSPIFLYALYLWLEPRIEDGDSQLLKKLTDPVAPAEHLLRFARCDKIHRPRKIDTRIT